VRKFLEVFYQAFCVAYHYVQAIFIVDYLVSHIAETIENALDKNPNFNEIPMDLHSELDKVVDYFIKQNKLDRLIQLADRNIHEKFFSEKVKKYFKENIQKTFDHANLKGARKITEFALRNGALYDTTKSKPAAESKNEQAIKDNSSEEHKSKENKPIIIEDHSTMKNKQEKKEENIRVTRDNLQTMVTHIENLSKEVKDYHFNIIAKQSILNQLLDIFITKNIISVAVDLLIQGAVPNETISTHQSFMQHPLVTAIQEKEKLRKEIEEAESRIAAAKLLDDIYQEELEKDLKKIEKNEKKLEKAKSKKTKRIDQTEQNSLKTPSVTKQINKKAPPASHEDDTENLQKIDTFSQNTCESDVVQSLSLASPAPEKPKKQKSTKQKEKRQATLLKRAQETLENDQSPGVNEESKVEVKEENIPSITSDQDELASRVPSIMSVITNNSNSSPVEVREVPVEVIRESIIEVVRIEEREKLVPFPVFVPFPVEVVRIQERTQLIPFPVYVEVPVLVPPPFASQNELDQNDLHLAVINNNAALVLQILQSRSLDTNAVDSYGNTASHYAARNNNIDIILLLKEFSANFLLKNNDGISAFDIALRTPGCHETMSGSSYSSSTDLSSSGRQRASEGKKFHSDEENNEQKKQESSNPKDKSEKKKDSIISISIDMINEEIEHLPKWIQAIIHKSLFYLQTKENHKYLEHLFGLKTILERFAEILKLSEPEDNCDENEYSVDKVCKLKNFASDHEIEKPEIKLPGIDSYINPMPFLASQ